MTQPHPLDQLRPFVEAYVDQCAKMIEAFRTAFQPVIDMYERDPKAFEEMCADARRERSCNCLCGLHKDAPDICESDAEPGLTRTFHSELVGTQHVPMCRPCHDATAVRA